MTKVEAATLAEAYEEAARKLNCSVADLNYEVIQHPSNGILGFMKKSAIIVVECTKQIEEAPKRTEEPTYTNRIVPTKEAETTPKKEPQRVERVERVERPPRVERVEKVEEKPTPAPSTPVISQSDDILNSFFDTKSYQNEPKEEKIILSPTTPQNNFELATKIENEFKVLFSYSCFDIDTIEVGVVDNTALIFIDGNDAALLIGKEGYRYNAISYMLFNWLYAKHNLYLKLEIAQFLTTQHEMIKSYIEPVIEYVKVKGRGKTRPLDGILVQIALEQLREAFPDKYVAVKSSRDGRRFVLINEFNSRNEG